MISLIILWNTKSIKNAQAKRLWQSHSLTHYEFQIDVYYRDFPDFPTPLYVEINQGQIHELINLTTNEAVEEESVIRILNWLYIIPFDQFYDSHRPLPGHFDYLVSDTFPALVDWLSTSNIPVLADWAEDIICLEKPDTVEFDPNWGFPQRYEYSTEISKGCGEPGCFMAVPYSFEITDFRPLP